MERTTHDLLIEAWGELEDLQAKHDRLKEYALAAVRTLMHERRYGPAKGAPGTEHIERDAPIDEARRAVWYPREEAK